MNDPASAEATYRPPAFELLTTARDVFHLPQPAPVLWRDPGPRTDPGEVDAVLSVGEVAILASAGGLGESCLILALAVEAATAAEAGGEYGNACGLRVKAAGAVLVSYEDSPARIGARLRWFTETAPERLHLWANPEPLFQTDPESRSAVTRCDAWPRLWEEIKTARPSLVIVDPVSAALADADTSQTGVLRSISRTASECAFPNETRSPPVTVLQLRPKAPQHFLVSPDRPTDLSRSAAQLPPSPQAPQHPTAVFHQVLPLLYPDSSHVVLSHIGGFNWLKTWRFLGWSSISLAWCFCSATPRRSFQTLSGVPSLP